MLCGEFTYRINVSKERTGKSELDGITDQTCDACGWDEGQCDKAMVITSVILSGVDVER